MANRQATSSSPKLSQQEQTFINALILLSSFFWISLTISVMEVSPQYSGCCGREMGFSHNAPHSWGICTYTPFFFPQKIIVVIDLFRLTLCHLEAKFLLPSPMHQNSYFCSIEVFDFLRIPGLLQKLSCKQVLSQVITLQVSPHCGEKGGTGSQLPAYPTTHTEICLHII